MAEQRDDDGLFWVDPNVRGILPLDNVRISRSLARTLRRESFEVRVDSDFAQVIRYCAEPAPGRDETWINDQIIDLYEQLHDRGFAHSVECWRGNDLVGGLYGLAIGGAFFGESMFSRATDSSKVALAHLSARLIVGGYQLLDVQFVTDHLTRLGVIGIPRRAYQERLAAAIRLPAEFLKLDKSTPGREIHEIIMRHHEEQ